MSGFFTTVDGSRLVATNGDRIIHMQGTQEDGEVMHDLDGEPIVYGDGTPMHYLPEPPAQEGGAE